MTDAASEIKDRDNPADAARQLARELRAARRHPFDITTAVGTLLAKAGIARPCALDVVRELPGLADYDHMTEYRRRYATGDAEAVAEGAGELDGCAAAPGPARRAIALRLPVEPRPVAVPALSREDVAEIVRDVMAAELRQAHDLLHRRRGGRGWK